MQEHTDLIRLRGRLVEEDENGNWNLSNIWELSRAPATKLPKLWHARKQTQILAAELQKRSTVSNLKKNLQNNPVIYARNHGGDEQLFAHPILAAAYAGYLSPKLELETREIWLRYRSGDASLADEILQKATPEENEWAAVRALGRAKRNEFTNTLQSHGVVNSGYAQCTNAVYSEVLSGTARELRAARGLAAGGNVRDSMTTDELVSVMFAETLARQRIEYEAPQGNRLCVAATKRSSAFVRQAIEAEAQDRHTCQG